MEQLVNDLTFGNPYEVKTVLASIAAALAVYQLVLIAVGYGRVRPGFLAARPASFSSATAITSARSHFSQQVSSEWP